MTRSTVKTAPAMQSTHVVHHYAAKGTSATGPKVYDQAGVAEGVTLEMKERIESTLAEHRETFRELAKR